MIHGIDYFAKNGEEIGLLAKAKGMESRRKR